MHVSSQYPLVKHTAGSGRLVMLSDLHLHGPEDPLYKAFLRFMQTELQQGDRLFIVGDLFDVCIGNKSVFKTRFQELIVQFKALDQKNIEIFYVEGNHDFHLRDMFYNNAHIHIFNDSFLYQWFDSMILFCHGDQVNAKDYGYKLFRLVTHNPISKTLLQIIPDRIVDVVSRSMSNRSRGYHADYDENTVRLFRNYACEQIEQGISHVVMGHSHFLDEMKFTFDGRQGQYVNVGFPRKHKKFLELTPQKKMIEFRSWSFIGEVNAELV